MRHALIINGHQKHDLIAEGNLTQIYIDEATKYLSSIGFDIKHTVVEDGYDIEEEVEKFSWAYYFILQFPVYWAGLPWMTKRYIDEIISAGQGKVTYENDGRSRKDPNKRYGSGGLMKGKRYMLSMTCNTPESEYNNPAGFFGDFSIDDINISTHKVFQFCGASKLQTYSVHDVYRGDLDMQIENEKFIKILKSNFL